MNDNPNDNEQMGESEPEAEKSVSAENVPDNASDNVPNAASDNTSGIEILNIPPQQITSGEVYTLELGQFARPREDQILIFGIENEPEGADIDLQTGALVGLAPTVDKNKRYAAIFRVADTETTEIKEVPFIIEVLTVAVAKAETEAVQRETQEMAFDEADLLPWQEAEHYEMRLFVQQLLNEHFMWVYFYEGEDLPEEPGALQEHRKAESGFSIYEFKNVVMVTAGEKAFSESGNRMRFLQTLREVYNHVLSKRNWDLIGIYGSDEENISRAWLIGKQLDKPVSEKAPNVIAEINYANMMRLYDEFSKKEPVPRP